MVIRKCKCRSVFRRAVLREASGAVPHRSHPVAWCRAIHNLTAVGCRRSSVLVAVAWVWRVVVAAALGCGDIARLMADSQVARPVEVVVVEVPPLGGVDRLAAPRTCRLPRGHLGCDASSELLVCGAVAAGGGGSAGLAMFRAAATSSGCFRGFQRRPCQIRAKLTGVWSVEVMTVG